jgi:hypothetical protein
MRCIFIISSFSRWEDIWRGCLAVEVQNSESAPGVSQWARGSSYPLVYSGPGC